jgi:hypothetical protein
MDWLTFLSRLVESLAWPLSVFLIVLYVRKPLRSLIPLLQRLKYRGLELEFGQRVEEIKRELARELPNQTKPTFPTEESQTLARLAEVSPRSAVLEAWRGVELAALAAGRKLAGHKFTNYTLTPQAISILEASESLDSNVIALLHDLHELRNRAAHAPEFALSTRLALRYAATAEAVVYYLKGVEAGSHGDDDCPHE